MLATAAADSAYVSRLYLGLIAHWLPKFLVQSGHTDNKKNTHVLWESEKHRMLQEQ